MGYPPCGLVEEVIPVVAGVACVRSVVERVESCAAGRPARVVVRDSPEGPSVVVEPLVGLAEPGGVAEFTIWGALVRARVPAELLRGVRVTLWGSEPVAPAGRVGVSLRVWGCLGDVLAFDSGPGEGVAAQVMGESVSALAGSDRVASAARGWLQVCRSSWVLCERDPQVCEQAVYALAVAPADVWETAFCLLPEWEDSPESWVAASFALSGHSWSSVV